MQKEAAQVMETSSKFPLKSKKKAPNSLGNLLEKTH
jgi:hypothetical protein